MICDETEEDKMKWEGQRRREEKRREEKKRKARHQKRNEENRGVGTRDYIEEDKRREKCYLSRRVIN